MRTLIRFDADNLHVFCPLPIRTKHTGFVRANRTTYEWLVPPYRVLQRSIFQRRPQRCTANRTSRTRFVRLDDRQEKGRIE